MVELNFTIDVKYMHDTVYEALNKSLSEKELEDLFLSLPKDIQLDALKWGITDTVVRDNIYEYLIEQNKPKPQYNPITEVKNTKVAGGSDAEYIHNRILFTKGGLKWLYN